MATNLSSSIRSISLSSDQIPDHPVIAAIDFGTSSSGYAFGFRDNGPDDIKLTDIQLNKWQIGSASSSTDKAPTTVLLKPDKSFDSFGYKAEDKYSKLCDTKRQAGWWYFQKFKMMLYETKLSRDAMLHDAEDKTMRALEVFSIVILHLKECILEDVRRQNPGIRDDDVLYVLTVPAIWSDAAKQFMREAATAPNVGIKDCQLTLVLEPEAASIYCRQRKSRVIRDNKGTTRLESLEVGHTYIILDLGGGTADIATHEVVENGKLHEIDCARGDDLGGQKFNENFLVFLGELFGEKMFREWRMKKHGDYLRLQRSIEGIKWEVADNEEDTLFEVPYSLIQYAKHESEKSVEETIMLSKFGMFVELVNEIQFLMKNAFVRDFFETILTGVTQHMYDISENTGDIIKTVFLVGGLAKSAYFRQFIQTKFPQYTLIVPEDPGVAVLKGAVLLGNTPQMIAGRISRYSYGIGMVVDFEEGKHDERYKFTRDGKVLCKYIFQKLIEKRQVLKYGDIFTTTTWFNANLPETKQNKFITELYQSKIISPFYITERYCSGLGRMEHDPPEGRWPDQTKNAVQIIVGEAEFKFYTKDSMDREYKTTVDFLSQKAGNKV